MIIRFINQKHVGDIHPTDQFLLEADEYRMSIYPYKNSAELSDIFRDRVKEDYRIIFDLGNNEGLREAPEVAVFMVEKNLSYMQYVVENSLVFVMNNDGKTVDKFRIS